MLADGSVKRTWGLMLGCRSLVDLLPTGLLSRVVELNQMFVEMTLRASGMERREIEVKREDSVTSDVECAKVRWASWRVSLPVLT